MRTYRPLVIREGRVKITIERSPYVGSAHIFQFRCGVCDKTGWYHRRQKDACDDAYDHISAEHLRMAHPES